MSAIEFGRYLTFDRAPYHACLDACVECPVTCKMCAHHEHYRLGAEAYRRCEQACRTMAAA